MNRLKSKASRFFRDDPSQDEKTAIALAGREADFDAGIERSVRKKPSRFFRTKSEKPLPAPPSNSFSLTGLEIGTDVYVEAVNFDAPGSTSVETDRPLPVPPVVRDEPNSEVPAIVNEKVRSSVHKARPANIVLKSRPSFASLRSTSSRIFRTNTSNHDPPPPPIPQLPIDTPVSKAHQPTLRPLGSVRSAPSSRSSSGRVVSISRPLSSAQTVHSPTTSIPSTFPFTKPQGPPPPRPSRPKSLDDELIALMRDRSTRMILHTPSRARSATTTTTTSTSSGRHSALTRIVSEEAYTRLGLPSGHSSLSSPRSPIFDSPLAANFPHNPSRSLPFRDSSGSVKGYGRFSAYVKARQQYSSGGYADGVDGDDREAGPVEQYRESKCGDWALERRVSGRLGERGMLFRDRWGGWHFVADV